MTTGPDESTSLAVDGAATPRGPEARPDAAADAAAAETAGNWLANAGSLVAGRLVVAALGWTGTVIIARSLEQEAFGRFSFVFGVLGMMTIVTDLGLGRVALSGVLPGADDRRRFAASYLALRFVLGLVGYALAVGGTALAGYPADIVNAMAVAGLIVVLATASNGFELILQAHLRMHVVAVASVLGRLGQLALTVAVVMRGGTVMWFILPAVAAELIIFAVKVPRALSLLTPSATIRLGLWRALLREAVPISIGTALATLYFRVDTIMLSQLDDFVAVAVYGVAFKFADVLHFLTLSIAAPVLTVLVRAWPDDVETFRETIHRTATVLALLSGTLVVGFGLFAEQIITLLYGHDYAIGARVAQVLVASEILAMASLLALTILTATSRHRLYPYVALAGLALNVGLNLWAIPLWSFRGAAAATVATEVLVLGAMWALVARNDLDLRLRFGFLWRLGPAMAAGLGTGALLVLVAHWIVAATAGLLAYVGAVHLLGLDRRAGLIWRQRSLR